MLTLRLVGEPSRTTQGVAIRAQNDVAEIVESGLGGRSGRVNLKRRLDFYPTHSWWFDGDPEPVEELCNMLSQVVVLPQCEEFDSAIAGDFYKVPPDDPDTPKWENTQFGGLVHRAKYQHSLKARRDLARFLARIIELHPKMDPDRIVIAPSTGSGLSEKLGRDVASIIGVSSVAAVRQGPSRPPAKEGRSDTNLESYSVQADLQAEHIVVIDDVWRSGVTARSVALAARDVGAATVCAVVGARTMKKK